MNTRKSLFLRGKVNSIYNEKLFTSNCYKFTDKTVKTTLTIVLKSDLYIENNFIINLNVFIIQNDHDVI